MKKLLLAMTMALPLAVAACQKREEPAEPAGPTGAGGGRGEGELEQKPYDSAAPETPSTTAPAPSAPAPVAPTPSTPAPSTTAPDVGTPGADMDSGAGTKAADELEEKGEPKP